MEVFLLILRLALAAVFGIAGVAKLLDRAGSGKAAAEFGIPVSLARHVAYLLPVAELGISISLIFVQSSWFGAIGAALVLLAFTTAMVVQLAKGQTPDCHCFGQIHSEPVGMSSILRNIGLLVLAGFLIFSGHAVQGLDFLKNSQDIILFLFGVSVVTLLAISVSYLSTISEQQVQIMRRIELMELVARDGASAVERGNLGHPHEGLPIGAVFPDFELQDLDGRSISLSGIRAPKLPVLYLFVSPSCTPCNALIPEFEQWQKDLDGTVHLILVTTGERNENTAKFGGDHSLTVLIQKERELADLVKAQWTPTAIFMDAKGRVASHVAAGDLSIRALVDDIKSRDLRKEFTYFTNGSDETSTNKIGETIPEFSIADIKGNQISADDLKGHKTLVAFWSLTCPFCQQMLEDLREWDRVKGKDDPSLVVFSDGDLAAHQDMGLTSPVILDEGHKTASGFGMFGTPSAVLVDESGRIISETAMGAPHIWSLVGKQK
jgi:peroxiredoxin/uncharacterized membrane protein YphA (DoxX/SURF4 family)